MAVMSIVLRKKVQHQFLSGVLVTAASKKNNRNKETRGSAF